MADIYHMRFCKLYCRKFLTTTMFSKIIISLSSAFVQRLRTPSLFIWRPHIIIGGNYFRLCVANPIFVFCKKYSTRHRFFFFFTCRHHTIPHLMCNGQGSQGQRPQSRPQIRCNSYRLSRANYTRAPKTN